MNALSSAVRQRFLQQAKRCMVQPRRQYALAPVRIEGQGDAVWVRVHLGDVILGQRLASAPNTTDVQTISLTDWERTGD